MSAYEVITKRILTELQNGIIPWAKGWKPEYHAAMNWATERPYQGINLLLTRWNGQYATYKQIKDAGGTVKSGAKSIPIVFWKPFEIEDPETKKVKQLFHLQYYSVFEIEVDTEGLKRKEIVPSPLIEKHKVAENYLNAPTGPTLTHGYAGASYDPEKDVIRMPSIGKFHSSDLYFKTLFHEIIHSTGYQSRLSRPLQSRSENLKSYAKEELVAEIGSAFLCNLVGIDSEAILRQNVSYIQSWLSVLEQNPQMLLVASSLAQKAVEFIIQAKVQELNQVA